MSSKQETLALRVARALLGLWALLSAGAALAHADAVRIDRLDAAGADAQAVVAHALDDRFVPETDAVVTPSREHETWYRVRLARDWTDAAPPVLTIADPQGLALSVFRPPGYAATEHSIYRADGNAGFTHRAISVVLPDDLRTDAPVYLRVAPASPVPRRVTLSGMTEARALDIVHARLGVLFPAIQLAALLVMLSFFLALRERVYAYFAGQTLFVALFECYAFGLGFEYAPFAWLAPLGIRAPWLMALCAGMLALGFAREFLGLRRHVPLLDRACVALWWSMLALAGVVLLPWMAPTWRVDVALALAFLAFALLLVAAGLAVWLRGVPRGGYYLFAWAPGLSFIVVRALQVALRWPEPAWLEFAVPATFAFAGVVLAFGLADHIVSMRQERDVANRLAERDTLTGAFSRRAILARLRAAFLAARERERALAVLFLDLDHFKRVNDSHGHRAGDLCLRAVIPPIAGELRHGDALGRYGGEEFLVVLPDATIADAEGVAERIRQRVETMPMRIAGMPVALTLSIGVAGLDAGVATPDELVERADVALYLAKSGGRNCVSTHRGPKSAVAVCVQDATSCD